MKTRKQLYLLSLVLVLLITVLNGILFYTSKCSVDYLQTKNIWGQSDSVKVTDYKRQKQLLSSLPSDTVQAEIITAHLMNFFGLSAKRQEKLLSSNPYADYIRSMNLTSQDLPILLSLYRCLYNVNHYQEFINNINHNVDNIADVFYPIGADAWVLNNAAKCKKDYYGMEHLLLPPVFENGFTLVIQYHATDFWAFLMLLLLFLLYYTYIKNQLQFTIPSFEKDTCIMVILGVLSVLLLYLSNLLITARCIDFPEFSLPIQAYQSFYPCPYSLTVGGFLALWIILKLLSQLLLLSLLFWGFTGKKHIRSILCVTLLLGAEAFSFRYTGEASIPLFFREINIFSGFTGERFFNRYLNLAWGSHPISRFPVFLTIFLIALAVAVILSIRRFRQFKEQTIQALQQVYFDEIDQRYQETRRLWHDFNNHLLAVKALYTSGNIPEAEKYIDDLSSHSREYLLPVKTGSNVVDLLLFKKTQQAKDAGYHLTATIGCHLNNCGIADYDLCSLLGNLIDNALEACREQTTTAQISLRMEEQNSMLFLSCSNPFVGLRKEQNGIFPTTKSDQAQHGIGLSSVKQVCRKYKGTLDISCENQIFTVNVLLNENR